jgi:hypothetical protein
MSCGQALALVADPNQRIHNIPQINAICDTQKRLLCCQGDTTTVSQSVCQSYWGPGNAGKCDSIISSYCAVNPADPACDCLTSNIPVPQCNDVRCANTTALRLSSMQAPCQGLTINCTQIVELGPGAQNNIVSNVLQQLNCGTDPNGTIIGNPTSTIGTGVIIGIIIVADFLICGAIIIGIMLWKKKEKVPIYKKPTPTPRKNTSPIKKTPVQNNPNLKPPTKNTTPIKKTPAQNTKTAKKQ